jgi:hypothetical protein
MAAPGAEEAIYAGRGSDVIHGGDGGDLITDGRGEDVVRGGGGDDEIWGPSPGSDAYFGGQGDDYADDTLGKDVYFGGTGRDQFGLGTGRHRHSGDFFAGGADSDAIDAAARVVIDLTLGQVSGAGGKQAFFGGAGLRLRERRHSDRQ